MNKSQANERLQQIEKEVEQLKKIINEPEVSKEKEMSDFLFEMFNKVNKFRITGEKETTYYIDKEWLFQQDCKNKRLWIRYSLIWSVFESKYKLSYNQIRDFIGGWVETNTGWKGLTPICGYWNCSRMVETNTGWKGLTPDCGLDTL